jgi:crotonobetainyl-CoA:carnitine CoA-transferase CaiB-like acyl-CoA transferase
LRPLDGIRVLDLTRLLPGAAATMLLANFGADVLKIEEPGGDYARRMPPLVEGDGEGEGAVFRATNRGKRSLTLDLKTADGKDTLRHLAGEADVLIEGFRPGVMRRLLLDYETLRPLNQRLIYVSLTGYGQTGPYAGMAGHDINYIALGGLLGATGAIPGAQIADLAGGSLQAVIGVLLALAARHKTGRGQYVDVSMLDGVRWLMTLPMAVHAATGEVPEPGNAWLSGSYACYRTYRARDGRWLAVGALEPKFWEAFCRVVGCPGFSSDQYLEGQRQTEMVESLSLIFASKPSAEWLELFQGADVCVTLVRNITEVAADPHLNADAVLPKLSETPGRLGERPPRLDEH